MHTRRRSIVSLGFAILLTALLGLSTVGVLAQVASPVATGGRPAHIHNGACPDVGDVVQPLNDLTAPTGTTTTVSTPVAGGLTATGPVQAEYSYTNVPMSLDDILASQHAINVHESAENINNYIACGDIGGTVDANGTLAIGLREVNDSGFTGIAVLTRNPNDPATTDVSVFIAQGLSENGD